MWKKNGDGIQNPKRVIVLTSSFTTAEKGLYIFIRISFFLFFFTIRFRYYYHYTFGCPPIVNNAGRAYIYIILCTYRHACLCKVVEVKMKKKITIRSEQKTTEVIRIIVIRRLSSHACVFAVSGKFYLRNVYLRSLFTNII